jgi:hypothetical protein
MAGQLVVAGRKTSWVRQFYRTEPRLLLNQKTGKEETVNCDVCCVILNVGAGTECGKPYKHSLSNGTKTLQRHLVNKHSTVEAIMLEMAKAGLNRPKVIYKIF